MTDAEAQHVVRLWLAKETPHDYEELVHMAISYQTRKAGSTKSAKKTKSSQLNGLKHKSHAK